MCRIARIEIGYSLRNLSLVQMSRNRVYHSCDSLNFRAFILSGISLLLPVLGMISTDVKVSLKVISWAQYISLNVSYKAQSLKIN